MRKESGSNSEIRCNQFGLVVFSLIVELRMYKGMSLGRWWGAQKSLGKTGLKKLKVPVGPPSGLEAKISFVRIANVVAA
jgi:hypothetical protein